MRQLLDPVRLRSGSLLLGQPLFQLALCGHALALFSIHGRVFVRFCRLYLAGWNAARRGPWGRERHRRYERERRHGGHRWQPERRRRGSFLHQRRALRRRRGRDLDRDLVLSEGDGATGYVRVVSGVRVCVGHGVPPGDWNMDRQVRRDVFRQHDDVGQRADHIAGLVPEYVGDHHQLREVRPAAGSPGLRGGQLHRRCERWVHVLGQRRTDGWDWLGSPRSANQRQLQGLGQRGHDRQWRAVFVLRLGQ